MTHMNYATKTTCNTNTHTHTQTHRHTHTQTHTCKHTIFFSSRARPINILSCFSKVYEKFLLENFVFYNMTYTKTK